MEPVKVVGIGPGALEYLTPLAEKVINSADILIAGERTLQQFAHLGKLEFAIKNNLRELVSFITANRHKEIAVLASGDPGMFGILNFLRKNFPAEDLQVIPGISSMQLACAKLKIAWHDALLTSVHGRPMEELLSKIRDHSKVIVLTDPQTNPQVLVRYLYQHGFHQKHIHLCANLSYPNEVVVSGPIAEMLEVPEYAHSVVVITDEE